MFIQVSPPKWGQNICVWRVIWHDYQWCLFLAVSQATLPLPPLPVDPQLSSSSNLSISTDLPSLLTPQEPAKQPTVVVAEGTPQFPASW